MKLNNILVVYTHPAAGESKKTLNHVKKILKKYKIHFNLADRDKLKREQFTGRNLIIPVGGDGTFLRAAQFVKSEPVFGVNADVKNKEGFFMKVGKDDFEGKLRKILENKIKIGRLPRLEAYINSKKIDAPALNEFYIGPKKAYHAAKYIIEFDGARERHKSSGILVTTPAGSNAWASSCFDRRLPPNSKNFQFVVREPYEGKVFKNYRLKQGILKSSQKIRVHSEMLDGVIVADSVGKEFAFRNGSKAVFRMSDNDLNLVLVK